MCNVSQRYKKTIIFKYNIHKSHLFHDSSIKGRSLKIKRKIVGVIWI